MILSVCKLSVNIVQLSPGSVTFDHVSGVNCNSGTDFFGQQFRPKRAVISEMFHFHLKGNTSWFIKIIKGFLAANEFALDHKM